MTFHSWVRFDTWFLRVRYGVRRTQPARLLKASKIHLKQIVYLTSFAEFGFLNELEMAYFNPFLTESLLKVVHF